MKYEKIIIIIYLPNDEIFKDFKSLVLIKNNNLPTDIP